jgi:hypothetical protein
LLADDVRPIDAGLLLRSAASAINGPPRFGEKLQAGRGELLGREVPAEARLDVGNIDFQRPAAPVDNRPEGAGLHSSRYWSARSFTTKPHPLYAYSIPQTPMWNICSSARFAAKVKQSFRTRAQ